MTATTTAPARQGASQRGRLGLAVVMVVVGSFLPWIDTAVGTLSGARGPGLYTAYAAMLGLAAVFLPLRRVAGIQAGLMSLVCLAVPAWQLVRAIDLLGFGGWIPGPGIVLVVGGGVLAGVAARKLLAVPAAS